MFPVTRSETDPKNQTGSGTRDISGKYILRKGRPVLHVLARKKILQPHAFLLIQEFVSEGESEVEFVIYRADFGPDITKTSAILKTIIYGDGKITIAKSRPYSGEEMTELRENHDFASREITAEEAENIKSKIASATPGMYSVSGELSGSSIAGENPNNCLTFVQGVLNDVLGSDFGQGLLSKLYPHPKAGVKEIQRKGEERRKKKRCTLS
jgi:hypothetical protein